MTYAPVFGPISTAGDLYVNANAPAGVGDGSIQQPFATIAAAIAAAAAGATIHIAPGAYAEDLTWVAGEDIDLAAAVPDSVYITGIISITDATVHFTNINITDDGVTGDDVIHFTGTAADVLRMITCDVQATAAGGLAIEADNPAGTVEIHGCRVGTTTGNANETIQLEAGTLDIRNSDITHGNTALDSLVVQGDALCVVNSLDCAYTGRVSFLDGAVDTVNGLVRGGSIVCGAISGINVAANQTVQLDGISITCTDAGGLGIEGAGTIVVQRDNVFLSTGDEYQSTLTVTHAARRIKHGQIAAAGASPQTDSVAFAQNFPTVNYTISLTAETTGGAADDTICQVDEGTVAVGGFDVVTTNAGAAAVGAQIHWIAIHP